MAEYNILYRGSLASCNYGCSYCPFAKYEETAEQLEPDRLGLQRFVTWIKRIRMHRIGVLFTPWGEALVRPWYREAMIQLSHLSQVQRVACQTNLSFPLNWVQEANRNSLAFWATFHPTETSLEKFTDRVLRLNELGIRMSVGVVGLKEHFAEIQRLREALPASIYLWVNAYKRESEYYNSTDRNFLTSIDPHFEWNLPQYRTGGLPCYAGETSFTVDSDGAIRRCHFISDVLGNIDDPQWEAALQPRDCTNETCGCHIGYVHFKPLELYSLYGAGILERIPASDKLT